MTEKKKKNRERPQGAMLLLNSSSSTSSIRHEAQSETYRSSTAVGCMSGIFRIFSKHHSDRRLKYLTFGRKEESSGSGTKTDSLEVEEQSGSVEVISTDSPRIPTKSSSALIVEAEKRTLLLGALAKCDEDLRELKKIIEELKADSVSVVRDDYDDGFAETLKVKDELLTTEMSSGEQPSPVSVLDEVTRSPPFSNYARGSSLQYGNFQQQGQIKKINIDEFLGSLHLINIQQVVQHGSTLRSSSLWCSRAMVETVEKTFGEMAWGEKREQGRIGMTLQEEIYRDLINDTVKEVMEIGNIRCAQHLKHSYVNWKLHSRGCMRRLSY